MANSKNYTDVGLNNDRNLNISNSSPSSDFDRLEDCNEAEFRGATLSLSRETSPPESVAAAGLDDLNGNVGAEASGDDKRRPSSTRLARSTNVQDFFAVREGALQKAAEQCRPVLLDHMDGDLRGIWLLTEIDHWDTEKERLLFLTEKSLISLKYDFITLKLLEYQRYDLKKFSQIVIGELKYPEKSLMPARNELGVQCSWGSLEQIPALKRWNPWSREIPWATYTSHPLFKMDTAEKTNYNIEDFSKTLVNTLSEGSNSATPMASPSTPLCKVLYQPIIIESYAGLAAALHNANELGFFKSRGKVSF
ncbi:tumor protein p63-regulated gene 1-like protein isoform X2 [Parasteatoda tepidariorum]|uniref:tumor protein p63-regulated gene 1-like protein isoform X2 n=1 Tax=Parasteatoda tepidariorum TaxID=114398 RepID=UPI000A2C0CAD|nr:tumor protein p63-regulated gene 1-like protein isoform X2 [Parasteatoda tepidariorum]